MNDFAIEKFWRSRIRASLTRSDKLPRGWSYQGIGQEGFQEAPLDLSNEVGGTQPDPCEQQILLVSAPGAVGKSTLAKQIAFETKTLYIDLAEADAVGANSITGGIAKAGLWPQWIAGQTSLLIDGLDEARLRVTQESFEAFLADVAGLSKQAKLPIVLFGRTGAIQDTWVILSDLNIEAPIFEIGYYGPEAAIDFAVARVEVLAPQSPHRAAERRAIELIHDGLRQQTEEDGDRFSGYAPVLLAVAERVANGNPAALTASIEKGEQPITLKFVTDSIMDRERGKLSPLDIAPTIAADLYLREEQLDRLVARVYGLPQPPLPQMPPDDAKVYSDALETWVAEHPFLSGGNRPSSAVFDAVIATRALKTAASSDVALKRELRKGTAANPFLSEFYLPTVVGGSLIEMPPEHIGVIYASLRARLSLGDNANLLVEGPDEQENEDALRAEVEINISRKDVDHPRIISLVTDQAGTLQLGAYVEDVDINVPFGKIEIGPGPEALIIAPASIQCAELVVSADKITVDSPRGSDATAVYFEAGAFQGGLSSSPPVIRGGALLAVSWPGSRVFPWTAFAVSPTVAEDPRVEEALRRFRKFVIAFRSHSKGSLARYKAKIEHARMTKGSGRKILNQMIDDGILKLIGTQYHLNAATLGSHTGTTYSDAMARRFGDSAIAFVSRALNR
jgi:hypothetical protein